MATKCNILTPLANKSGKKVFLEETTYEFCPELWNIIKDYLFGNQNDKLLFLFKATRFYQTVTIGDLVSSYSYIGDKDEIEAKALERAFNRRVKANHGWSVKISIDAFKNLYKMKRWRVIIDRKISEYKKTYKNSYYIEEKRNSLRTGEEKTLIYLKNDVFNSKIYIAKVSNMGIDTGGDSLYTIISECRYYRKEYEVLMNIIKSA